MSKIREIFTSQEVAEKVEMLLAYKSITSRSKKRETK